MIILISTVVMSVIGGLFALFLVYGNKKFHVEVDPRISSIEEKLPGVNCSGCGYASCAAYAEAVALNNEKVNKCVVGGEGTTAAIAEIMGVAAESSEKMVAVVMCQGDLHVSQFIGKYEGIEDCAAAVYSTTDVTKRCKYGCIGMGSCVKACPFDAIHIDKSRGVPVVDAAKCTACGNCVEACPRHLIELHPVSRQFFVYCKNHDPTLVARNICKTACIACGICTRNAAKDENAEAVQLVDNLAVVNYSPYTLKGEYGEKCPTKAFNSDRNVISIGKVRK